MLPWVSKTSLLLMSQVAELKVQRHCDRSYPGTREAASHLCAQRFGWFSHPIEEAIPLKKKKKKKR